MKLENINFDSSSDFLHLERFVNDGSPSGFTDTYTTSFLTSPRERFESFYLCGLKFHDESILQIYGSKPEGLSDNWHLLVHPDMLYDPNNNYFFSLAKEIKINAVKVAPTASCRTVKMLENNEWFIKLHYAGLIGRVDRGLTINHASSAVEVTDFIRDGMQLNKLPSFFHFQCELYAKVAQSKINNKSIEWGMVYREAKAWPLIEKKHFLIPAFSLFSTDRIYPNDPTLLEQIIWSQNKKVEEYLFEDIISPIYSTYFNLLLNLGIQLECHAQNTLFAIDENYKIMGMVARDAESIDKDISLMEERNINHSFQTNVYKCRYRQNYKYFIMHSFMFDFKLGEYLISPIIDNAHKKFGFNKSKLIQKIKEFNEFYIRQLPPDFFPSDKKWYKNSKRVHKKTGKQKYISKMNPKFRIY